MASLSVSRSVSPTDDIVGTHITLFGDSAQCEHECFYSESTVLGIRYKYQFFYSFILIDHLIIHSVLYFFLPLTASLCLMASINHSP